MPETSEKKLSVAYRALIGAGLGTVICFGMLLGLGVIASILNSFGAHWLDVFGYIPVYQVTSIFFVVAYPTFFIIYKLKK